MQFLEIDAQYGPLYKQNVCIWYQQAYISSKGIDGRSVQPRRNDDTMNPYKVKPGGPPVFIALYFGVWFIMCASMT
jgi:hypothetical protein